MFSQSSHFPWPPTSRCSSPSHLLPKLLLGKACWVSSFQMPGQEKCVHLCSVETRNFERQPSTDICGFELRVLRSNVFRHGSLPSTFKEAVLKAAGGRQSNIRGCSCSKSCYTWIPECCVTKLFLGTCYTCVSGTSG